MLLFRKMNWALVSCWGFPQLRPATVFCSYWQAAVKGLKTECSTCMRQNSWAASWIVSQLELTAFNPIKELGKGGSLGFVGYEDISLVSVVPSAGKYQTPSEIVILLTFFNVYIWFTWSHSDNVSGRARNKIQCRWPSGLCNSQSCPKADGQIILQMSQGGEGGCAFLLFYFNFFFWENKEELLEISMRRVCALHVGYSEMN